MAGGTKRFLKGLAKEMNPKDPWFIKTGDRNINNLWTGHEFGGRSKFAAGVGALGYGGYKIGTADSRELQANAAFQDIQSLPGTRADMMGYYGNAGDEANQLQPTGDLVFALNRLRHEGWM